MRDYALMRPRFWTQGTGRELRGYKEAQIVALYLISSPHSNLIGLYYLPLSYLAHETGLTPAEVLKGFVRLSELEYAHYDEASEYVWVVNMAREQSGSSSPKEGDKRALGVSKELDRHRKSPFFADFVELYRSVFGLTQDSPLPKPPMGGYPPPPKGVQAPSEPLRWMERDQDQDQDQDRDQDRERECEGDGRMAEPEPATKPEPHPAAPATPVPSKKEKRPKASATGCPMADDATAVEWLASRNLPALDSDNGREIEKFLNHHSAKGTLSARWAANWATWRGNWARFDSREHGPAAKHAQPTGQLPPLLAKPPPPPDVPADIDGDVPTENQAAALLAMFDNARKAG